MLEALEEEICTRIKHVDLPSLAKSLFSLIFYSDNTVIRLTWLLCAWNARNNGELRYDLCGQKVRKLV